MNTAGPCVLLGALLVLAPAVLEAQDAVPTRHLDITVEHDSPTERATVEQLRTVVDAHDAWRWTWTRRIHIDQTEIPHSHPVLTLHTRYVGDDASLLATYLHEQFHWWAVERQDAVEAAIADFRAIFPEVPVGNGRGARDERSTYLHLIVCDLELQAVSSLIGDDAARELLASNRHYTWIYATVLDDARVREVNLRHGFDAQLADALTP